MSVLKRDVSNRRAIARTSNTAKTLERWFSDLARLDELEVGDSPQFQAINLGHATDTTLSRDAAGELAVEGVRVLKQTAIGSTVQAYDADLTTLGAGGAGARSFLGLAIGTDIQAYDADTAAIAALAHSAGNAIVSNGTTWLSEPLDTYNAIINGDFDIWQRGTSFSSVANGDYSADRWKYVKLGAMVHDVQRSTDVPTVAQAGRLFNYSILVDCTTVDSSIASTDFCALGHYVEGFMWEPLSQRSITLSFWVKGTKTGVHTVALRNSGSDRAFCAEYTINASDTWEHKTVTVTASPSAGTWDYTTGVGIAILWTLAAGSAYQGTNNTWTSGNHLTTANQVNACDSTSNNFRITGVRLVAGSVAKPLIQRPYAQELLLAKRYYEIVPAGWAGAASSGNANGGYGACEVEKRTTPTVTWLSNMGVLNFPTTTHSNFVFASTKAIFPFRTASGTGQDSRYHDLYAVAAEL